MISCLASASLLLTVEMTVTAVVRAMTRNPMGLAAIAAPRALKAPERLNVAVVAAPSAVASPIVARVCCASSLVRPLAVRIIMRCSVVRALLLTTNLSCCALSPFVTVSSWLNCSVDNLTFADLPKMLNAADKLDTL